MKNYNHFKGTFKERVLAAKKEGFNYIVLVEDLYNICFFNDDRSALSYSSFFYNQKILNI